MSESRRALLTSILIVACGQTVTQNDGGLDASSDATKEASVQDAATDVHPDADAGIACSPNLPNGYTPAWIPPSAPSGACTTTQIQSLYDDCAAPNHSASACNAFLAVTSNANCDKCMETPIGAQTYGPTIEWHNGDSLDANVAGCMALVDGDASTTGCGAKYGLWLQCQIDACSYCPSGTYSPCAQSAQTGVCGAYASAAKQCASQSTYAACFAPTTFESYFTTYGAMFCAAD